MTDKLDKIREEKWGYFWSGYCEKRTGCPCDSSALFDGGWDAAMERVKPLVDFLEEYTDNEGYDMNIKEMAKLLADFKG